MIQQSPTERADPYRIHMAHCDQGDYEGSCKYGDDDCPALATQAAQPAEADGWVMVPREPTQEMREAATPPAPNDDLRAALEWIDYHKDDQDMNHVNFRIGAGSRARDALAALKDNRRG